MGTWRSEIQDNGRRQSYQMGSALNDCAWKFTAYSWTKSNTRQRKRIAKLTHIRETHTHTHIHTREQHDLRNTHTHVNNTISGTHRVVQIIHEVLLAPFHARASFVLALCAVLALSLRSCLLLRSCLFLCLCVFLCFCALGSISCTCSVCACALLFVLSTHFYAYAFRLCLCSVWCLLFCLFSIIIKCSNCACSYAHFQ